MTTVDPVTTSWEGRLSIWTAAAPGSLIRGPLGPPAPIASTVFRNSSGIPWDREHTSADHRPQSRDGAVRTGTDPDRGGRCGRSAGRRDKTPDGATAGSRSRAGGQHGRAGL